MTAGRHRQHSSRPARRRYRRPHHCYRQHHRRPAQGRSLAHCRRRRRKCPNCPSLAARPVLSRRHYRRRTRPSRRAGPRCWLTRTTTGRRMKAGQRFRRAMRQNRSTMHRRSSAAKHSIRRPRTQFASHPPHRPRFAHCARRAEPSQDAQLAQFAPHVPASQNARPQVTLALRDRSWSRLFWAWGQTKTILRLPQPRTTSMRACRLRRRSETWP